MNDYIPKQNKNAVKGKGGKNYLNTIQVNFEYKVLMKYDVEILFVKFFVLWQTADYLSELIYILIPYFQNLV